MARNVTVTAEPLSLEIGHVLLPSTIVLAILIVIGLIINVVILCIYLHIKKKTNLVYFIITLTFANIVLMVFLLPVELYKQWNYLVFTEDWLCRGGSIFNICAVFNTAIMVLVIACERFLKLCMPLKALKWLRPSCIKRICICATLGAFAVSIPAGYFFGVRSVILEYNATNVTIFRCSLDKSAGAEYEFSRVMFVCVFAVTMVPTVILYFIIFITIYKRPDLGRQYSACRVNPRGCETELSSTDDNSKIRQSHSRRHNRLYTLLLPLKERAKQKTLLMLVITLLYIIAIVIRMVVAMDTPKSETMIKRLLQGEGIGRRFVSKTDVLNSIIQPLIFAVFHAHFKTELKSIWRSSFSRLSQSRSSTSRSSSRGVRGTS